VTQDKTKQYLKTQVQTASKEQLVVMLYDGAIRFGEQAKSRIDAKDIEGAHNLLVKTQKIVMELLCALNTEEGGEIAGNLVALYKYMYGRLIEANIYKDKARLDEVLGMLRSLRTAWAQAVDNMRKASEVAPLRAGE